MVLEVAELEMHACCSADVFSCSTGLKVYRTLNSRDTIPLLCVGVVYRAGTTSHKYYLYLQFVN
jgi:hypothetical protein